MADRSESDELAPMKATEMGPIFWISIGLGTVASLPMFSGMANGSVSIARGAMWFLITTLVAMVGVWTISWLMHVFTDPYPDDDRDDDLDADGRADLADRDDSRPSATAPGDDLGGGSLSTEPATTSALTDAP